MPNTLLMEPNIEDFPPCPGFWLSVARDSPLWEASCCCCWPSAYCSTCSACCSPNRSAISSLALSSDISSLSTWARLTPWSVGAAGSELESAGTGVTEESTWLACCCSCCCSSDEAWDASEEDWASTVTEVSSVGWAGCCDRSAAELLSAEDCCSSLTCASYWLGPGYGCYCVWVSLPFAGSLV